MYKQVSVNSGTFIVSDFSSAIVDKNLALCLSFKLHITS